jgi:peptidoglycan/LPS O-acetylase OafA/YrhL
VAGGAHRSAGYDLPHPAGKMTSPARRDLATLRYYRPELDILRFCAFFLVFLSHAVPATLSPLIVAVAAGGAFGVDLFFALSSFLITTLLLREQRACGTIDVSSFYVRRILRIWPLYFAFLFVVVPLLPNDGMPLKYIVAFALLAGNWACVAWGYPPHTAAGPLWSVSIEEQFYLTWPLVMRRWIRHLARVAIALLVVSFVTRFWLVAHGAVHPQIWCNTLARLDPIACGALLAVYADRKPITLSPWMRITLLLFGFAVLTAAGRYGDFVGTRALVTLPVVTAACVALILGTLGVEVTANPITRALIYLGRISYGLYVFHLMFIYLLGNALLALPATIVAAALSYHAFERPFLRVKEKFTRVQSVA